MMKKTILAVALLTASAGAFAQSAADADGSWLVRLRAVHADSVNKDSTGQHLSINNKWIAEADISYFFTPNLAAELILGLPQTFHVSAGSQPIGSLKGLPPTLTLQYHFTGLGQFKPYLGAGINYTRFSSVDLLHGVADVTRNSFGPALQAGLDFAVTKNIYLNLDVKKVWIRTKVSVGGTELGTFRLDPLLVGVGVGYRF
jgi:outer membrane protein